MTNTKIFALGGMGEDGKNLYIVEVDGQIFILDAGLIHPKIDLYGIDAVIPKIDYLIENKNKIVGVFVSHGHIDNMGAIPYLLKHLKLKVYATPFAIKLIQAELQNDGIKVEKWQLNKVNDKKMYRFGNVKVSFFNVNHALPEACGIVIHTAAGLIVYATDFNFSKSLCDKYKVSYDRLLELSKNDCLAILSESVGISDSNRTTSNKLFELHMYNYLSSYNNKVFICCYSTDVSRIQKIIDIAKELNRKIAFFYKKSETIIDTAIKQKYLEIPDNLIVNLDDNTVENPIIFVVGYYNEPYNLLSKIIENKYKNISVSKEDLIIALSDAVSGTEKYVLHVLDLIYRNDIPFKQIENKDLRTSHATSDDLTQLYAIANPKYIIPIKGEERHLARHIELLKELNYFDKYIDIQDGNVANFTDATFTNYTKISIGDIYVDGSLTGSVNENIVNERDQLANGGIVEFLIYIDSKAKKLVKEPLMISKGVVLDNLNEDNIEKLIKLVSNLTNNSFNKPKNTINDLENTISIEASKLLLRITKNKIMVLPVIIDLKNTKY